VRSHVVCVPSGLLAPLPGPFDFRPPFWPIRSAVGGKRRTSPCRGPGFLFRRFALADEKEIFR